MASTNPSHRLGTIRVTLPIPATFAYPTLHIKREGWGTRSFVAGQEINGLPGLHHLGERSPMEARLSRLRKNPVSREVLAVRWRFVPSLRDSPHKPNPPRH
jgi:hypothetical protein